MAQRFLTSINLTQNEIINATLQQFASPPTEGNFKGRLIFDTTENLIKVHDGTGWRSTVAAVSIGGDHSAALTASTSNGAVTITPNLATGSTAGVMSATDKALLDAATNANTANALAKRDSQGRMQSSTPSADLDVANKAYVDAARSGLDAKQSVKFATNEALPSFTHSDGVLTGSTNGALTVDSGTPTAGDRILVKNEITTNAPYNGIYVVTAVGNGSNPYVLTRSTDANSSETITPGMFVFVEQGTVWADSGWILTSDGAITVGSTNLTFVQFSAAGQTIAGNGLTKTGNAIDVVGTVDRIVANSDSIDIASTYVGQTSITTLGTVATGTWEATDVGVAHGGTGSSTASGARSNLAETATGYDTSEPVLARVLAKTVGNGTDTSFTITHNLGTRDVIVQVYDVTVAGPQYDTVYVDAVRSTTNTVTVTFAAAPSSNQYRVVITG